MCLSTETSGFRTRGVPKSGCGLPTVPKVKLGGLTNWVVSNHCAAVGLSSFEVMPVEFGRVDRKLLAPRIINGKPLSNTNTPSTCHPPIRVFTKPFELCHLFLEPNGSS